MTDNAIDEFDDDLFDNLPPQTFIKLEQEAFLATQQPHPYSHPDHYPHGQREEIVNLDDYTIPAPKSSQVRIAHRPNYTQQQNSNSQSGDLRAAFEKLEQEHAILKASAEQAQAQALTKSGEVSILRKRLEKSTRDYEQRLDVLRKSKQEAEIKSKLDIEAIRKEREKVETDKKFLEHDIAQNTGNARSNFRRAVPISNKLYKEADKHNLSHGLPSGVPYGDGFGTEAVPLVSPSKLRTSKSFDVSAPSTPSRRQEKKRKKPEDSPAGDTALPLVALSPVHSPWNSFTLPGDDYEDLPNLQKPQEESDDFLRQIMNYQLPTSNNRFFDILAQHSIGSDPKQTLLGLLLDNFSKEVDVKSSSMKFIIAIGNVWEYCSQQHYDGAVDLLALIVNYIFSSRSYAFIQEASFHILPRVTKSIESVTYLICTNAMNIRGGGLSDGPEPLPNIDLDECFVLIQIIALACRDCLNHFVIFWSIVNLDWVLTILAPAQPSKNVKFCCNLLGTCTQTNSFGPIWKGENKNNLASNQEESEQVLIQHVSKFLVGTTSDSPNVIELLGLRLTVLRAMNTCCIFPRDASSLARHPDAIGRIIQFLYEVIDLLYSPNTYAEDTHELAVTCVNSAMKLLFHISNQQAGKFDLRDKLKSIKGGAHLYLIALTRLAFCESHVLEKGIEPAVSDAAHTLLDELLSPVEGEQLLKMFPSADSTGTFNSGIERPEENTTRRNKDTLLVKEVGSRLNPMEID